MSSILIYNASWHTFGGGEKYACAMADALASTGRYAITLLIEDPSITKEKLSRYFNLSLERVTLEHISRTSVRKRLASADIAVIVSNFRSFGNPAKKNVYVLQIPYPSLSPTRIAQSALGGKIREAGKDLYRRALLSTARESDLVLVYSHFVRDVLAHCHNINATVLHPAIDDFAAPTQKEYSILSVGRIFRGLYNDKRYDMLVEAFRKLRERLPHTSWMYHIVGSCANDPESQRYLDELRAAAVGHPIYFHVNTPYDELRDYYNRASLFWHAAGYGIDEERFPEHAEHFGMSTVEAMSAGCVPIVVNRGGQKEIVSHGESGYLWNTPDELVDRTIALMDDPALRASMQQRVRTRFHDFDQRHFSERLVSLFNSLS
jgi:glycosyltransferase involved in cell wall biosynthesis